MYLPLLRCQRDLGGSLIRQSSGTTESTRILGALPFRSQTKVVKKREGVAPPSRYLLSAPDPTLRSSGWITSWSRSGDVIHPLLRNVGSGAETTRV